jgi:hypothetical protein
MNIWSSSGEEGEELLAAPCRDVETGIENPELTDTGDREKIEFGCESRRRDGTDRGTAEAVKAVTALEGTTACNLPDNPLLSL